MFKFLKSSQSYHVRWIEKDIDRVAESAIVDHFSGSGRVFLKKGVHLLFRQLDQKIVVQSVPKLVLKIKFFDLKIFLKFEKETNFIFSRWYLFTGFI